MFERDVKARALAENSSCSVSIVRLHAVNNMLDVPRVRFFWDSRVTLDDVDTLKLLPVVMEAELLAAKSMELDEKRVVVFVAVSMVRNIALEPADMVALPVSDLMVMLLLALAVRLARDVKVRLDADETVTELHDVTFRALLAKKTAWLVAASMFKYMALEPADMVALPVSDLIVMLLLALAVKFARDVNVRLDADETVTELHEVTFRELLEKRTAWLVAASMFKYMALEPADTVALPVSDLMVMLLLALAVRLARDVNDKLEADETSTELHEVIFRELLEKRTAWLVAASMFKYIALEPADMVALPVSDLMVMLLLALAVKLAKDDKVRLDADETATELHDVTFKELLEKRTAWLVVASMFKYMALEPAETLTLPVSDLTVMLLLACAVRVENALIAKSLLADKAMLLSAMMEMLLDRASNNTCVASPPAERFKE